LAAAKSISHSRGGAQHRADVQWTGPRWLSAVAQCASSSGDPAARGPARSAGIARGESDARPTCRRWYVVWRSERPPRTSHPLNDDCATTRQRHRDPAHLERVLRCWARRCAAVT